MSVGINVLIELARRATRLFDGEFDIEIIEKHHHNKLDAPSGTALMIADAINAEADGAYEYVYDRHDVRQKRGRQELGISAVRGGGIVGEHEVLFCGPEEVVTHLPFGPEPRRFCRRRRAGRPVCGRRPARLLHHDRYA